MNVFSDLQQSVIKRLTATDQQVPSLAPKNGSISWLTEDIGDLGNVIDRAIAKMGIVGIVMTPGGGKLFKLGVYPMSLECPIVIQTQENVTVNRGAAGTQVPSLDLVQFCLKRLHLWSPTGQRLTRVECDETPYILVSEAPLLTYNIHFRSGITVA